jgi:predicted metal-dependent phosphoesterase TrpH
MIDLHMHSTYSDGEWPVRSVVEEAARRSLSTIALTDHDTVAGILEAQAVGAAVGVRVIPGVELSSEFSGTSLHVLGYFVDPTCPVFEERLTAARDARDLRNPKIVERLRELGLEITMAEVEAVAGEGGAVGRPHIARVLLDKGYCSTAQEVFSKYLGEQGEAYLPKRRIPPHIAFKWIHDAGGVAVIAHPRTLRYKMPKLNFGDVIGRLMLDGLDGVECYYSGHDERTTRELLNVASRMKLAITGGSDFHGPTVRPKVSIGVGYGKMAIRDELLDGLVAAWRKRHKQPEDASPECLQ